MKHRARIIKVLRDNKLLRVDDPVMSLGQKSDLDPSHFKDNVLVLVRNQRKKPKIAAPEAISHFTFSDGKNSFMFLSRDKEKVGAIADFIIDLIEEEEPPC